MIRRSIRRQQIPANSLSLKFGWIAALAMLVGLLYPVSALAAGFAVTATTLPNGTVGVPYSQTLTAGAGTPPYTWALTGGTLPAGLTLAPSTGVISGTPSATGVASLTFRATDSTSATASSSPIPLTIQQTTTTTLTPSLGSPSRFGSIFALTATVAPSTATGKVIFYDGNSILGFKTLSGGSASLSYPLLSVGPHNLGAVYTGDTVSIASNSAAHSQTVLSSAQSGFATGVSAAVGPNPWSLAIGDFNNDGKPDAVVPNYGALPGNIGGGTTVSILLGTGNPAAPFATQSTVSVATGPIAVAVGDFNEDGNQDIAVAGYSSNSISILLGNGAGGFTRADFSAGGANPTGFAIADFNGDGHADLAVANNGSGNVSVYFGTGTGTFTFSATYTTGPYPAEVIAADLNKDGSADLLLTNNNGAISVLLGQSNGTFGAVTNYPTGGTGTGSLVVGDFNGDGFLDVVAAQGTSANIAILLGTGSGTLGTATLMSGGRVPLSLKAGDFNGDGKLDLVVSNNTDSNVDVFLGNGNGTFGTGTVYGAASGTTGSLYAVVADLNSDGVSDLILTNNGSATVSVLMGVATSTTTLTSSANPSNFNQAVTLTATVFPSTGTGTITFKDGSGSTIGTGTLTNGVATLVLANLPAGTNSLTAAYPGDTTDTANTSNTLSQVVRTAVVVSTTTLSPARVGTLYSIPLTATGGTGTFAWSIGTGTLPTGVTLASNGTLSGTPTVTGTFTFTVQATDTASGTGTQTLSLLVNAANSVFNGQQVQVTWYYPNLTTIYQPSLTATVGAGVEFPGYAAGNNAFNIDFSDTSILISSNRTGSFFDPAQPFNGLVITNPGGLPAFTNVSIGSTNWTDGTTTFDSSRVSFDPTHIYLNFKGMLNQIGMSLTLQVNGLVLTPATLPGSAVGFPYSTQISTVGGTGTGRVFSVTAGALPTGLSLNTSTGLISGVPTAAGTFTPTIQVVDSASNTTSVSYSVVIRANGTINTRWQANPTSPYSGPGVIGSGGDTWNLFSTATGSGALNDNLGAASLASVTWAADGSVSNNPSDSNSFCYPSPNSFCPLMGNYLYKTSGAAGNVTFGGLPANTSWDLFLYQQIEASTSPRQISITVNGVTSATSSPTLQTDTTFILNRNYLLTTATTDGSGQLVMSFHGTGGDLEGDINGIQLRPHLAPLTITQSTIPSVLVNSAYSTTLTAAGGTGTGKTWTVTTGTLPATVTLSSGGVLAGTPAASGTYNFTAQVTDSQGNQATQALTLVVYAPVTVTTSTLPSGIVGVAYNQTLAAAGGTSSYTWSITSGTLPAGLSLNSGTGAITGTPTATASTPITFKATDTNSVFGSATITLTVNPALSVTTSTLPFGTVGTGYSQTLGAAGGTGGYTWSILSGTLPAGLSLTSGTGVISGTPTTAVISSVTFVATDSSTATAQKTIILTVQGPSTTTVTSSLASPSQLGRSILLTATVAPSAATGKVTFYDGTTPLGTSTLSSGTATLTTSLLASGTHKLRAYFLGGGIGLPSTSPVVSQTVNSISQAGFGTAIAYTSGTGPWGVATADFNKDGISDVVVANYSGGGGNTVSVYLGSGTGTLAAQTTFTTATAPIAVATGDFNGDGNMDIAVACYQGNAISILLGNGSGGFAAAVNYTAGVGAQPEFLVVGDFDDDGNADIASANNGSANVSVLLGTGTGTFGTGVIYATGPHPGGIVAGDFNGDGKTDLAVPSFDNANVSVLLGTGAGIFGSATTYPTGGTQAYHIAAGDFNGDGKLDLVSPNAGSNNVGVLLGTGSGTFGGASVFGVGTFPTFVGVGDFNGDGKLDLVVNDSSDGNVIVLPGNGSGSFGGGTTYALAAGAIGSQNSAVADLNGDGITDLIVTTPGSNAISVLLGIGTTTTTLTSSQNPTYTLSTTLTATVSPSTATGTVTFYDGGSVLGSSFVTAGVATLSVTNLAAGTRSYTAVYGGDATNGTSTSAVLTETVILPTVTITTGSPLPQAGINTPYSVTLGSSGSTGTLNWAVTSGALPSGLTLGVSTGLISGTPTVVGTTNFTITATDPSTAYVVKNFALTVNPPLSITSTTLPLGVQFSGYGASVSGSGGSGNYSWSATGLPSGLSINASGLISGSSNVSGSYSPVITMTDTRTGGTAQTTLSLTINIPITVTTSSFPATALSESYNQTLQASGGLGGYTWSIATGGLPTGVSLNPSTGQISGTPTSTGTFSATYRATDAASNFGTSGTLAITVNTALTITTNSIPSSIQNQAYGYSISATGGSGNLVWSIATGALPSGMSLTNAGLLTGTPTAAGTFSFTARVTDAGAGTTTQAFSVTIIPALAISTTTLPLGRQGAGYSQALAVSNGTGPYSWTVVSGTLPAGLSLASNGTLSGTPSGSGTSSFTVGVTDSLNASATQTLSLLINNVNSVFNGQQVQVTWLAPNKSTIFAAAQTATVGAGVEFPGYASGNPAFNIDFSDTTVQITSNTTSTPFGTGVFNGLVITNPGGLPPFTNATLASATWATPGAVLFDSSRITFDATHIYLDFQGMANQTGVGITLQVNGLSLSTTTLPDSAVGFPYSTQLTTVGGTGLGRIFSLSGSLPTGLTLNTSTGVISGVPTTAGTFTPTIQVTDSGGNTATLAYNVVIRANGTFNTRWQGTPTSVFSGPAAIGVTADTWNLFSTGTGSGVLKDNAGQASPVGVTWTSDTAWYSNNRNAFCTPSPNAFCQLMNGYLAKNNGVTANVTFGGLPANTSWDMYLYQQIDSGGSRRIEVTVNGGTPVATTVDDSSTDSTFILNKNYLIATGTTDGSGNFSINYRGIGSDPEADINGIQLRPHLVPLTITQTTVPAGVRGAAYSTTLTATGGTGTGQTWTVVGGILPLGITLNASGVLSGTAASAGNFSLTAQVTDSQGNQATQVLALLINPAVSILTSSLPPATSGVAYSQTLSATGGFGGYTWSLITGTLPAGLTLNSSTGVISGTTTAIGVVNVTFRATDTGSNVGNSSAIPLTVLSTSSITLSTSATPSLFGSSVALTATLAPSSATGTVVFYDGPNVLGRSLIASGTAVFNTRLLPTGPHKLRALYTGDSLNAQSASTNVGQTVNTSAQDRLNGGTRLASGGTGPWAVAAGDFNLDGKTDIVVVNNSGNNVSVFLGTGTGYPGSTPTNFAVGSNPMYVAVGDFNGDGKPDLAVSNRGSGNISILLGDGAGGFATAVNYTVGALPMGIIASDFNGDGTIDLAVVNNGGNNVSILFGNGNGTFAAGTTYATGTGPTGLIAGDFNGDGYPDLAVANQGSNNVSILLGASNGTFGSPVNYSAGGTGTGAIVTADFNSDGKLDLAVTNATSNNLGVFLGVGDGTFGTVALTATQSGPSQLSVGDFNGDGKVDLAVPQTGYAVWLFAGDGAGNFTILDTVGSTSLGTAVADFNGDGRTDLVFTDNAASVVGIHLGLAPATISLTTSANPGVAGQNVTLTATVTPSTATGSIQFLEGSPLSETISLVNGVATLAVPFTAGFHFVNSAYSGDGTYQGGISNTLSQQIVPPVTITTSSLAPGVQGAAYSQTLAASGGSGSYTWSITGGALPAGLTLKSSTGAITGTPTAFGNPSITFKATDTNTLFGTAALTLTINPPVTITTSTLPSGAVGAAYNQTLAASGGLPTLGAYTWSITSGNLQPGLSLNSSTGLISGTPSAGGTVNIAFRATDSAGNFGGATLTVAIAGGTTTSLSTSLTSPSAFSANLTLTASVSPNTSTGKVTFYDGASVIGTGTLSSGSATVSTNQLGAGIHNLRAYYQGAALSLPSSSSGVIQTITSRPQAGFSPAVAAATGAGPWMGATADFNGDGKTDFVVAHYGASTISVFLGDGLGGLGTATTVSVGTNPISVVTGDFNGDGKADIAVANLLSDDISVLLGDGDGGFATPVKYAAGGTHPSKIIAGDFNNDGLVDLATVNYNTNNVSVLRGNGDGTFNTATLYPVGTSPAGIVAGDFNHDGITDLATANQVSNDVSVLLGQSAGGFAAAVNYAAGGTQLQGITAADFNADGNLDLVVANHGSNNLTLLAGAADGTFGTATVIGASSGPYFVASGDFNGDGLPDVAVAEEATNTVSVFLGNGSLTFATSVHYNSASGANGARAVTVTDLNGDGVSDLIVSNYSNNALSVLLGLGTTTTTLTSTTNPSTVGQAVSITATVSPTTAQGIVTLKDGSLTLGSGTLNAGTVNFLPTFTTAGTHNLVALYAGNTYNAASTSSTLSQVVGQAAVSVSVSTQATPITFGNSAAFTANVSPTAATGTVTFLDGGTAVGTSALSVGVASLNVPNLSAGAHSITAHYDGDANYLTNVSGAITQTVNQRTTTTSLTASPNPVTSGQQVTMTATVTPNSATGSVTFFAGTTNLGAATIISGVATLNTGTPTAGTFSLTAVYGGDTNNSGSTSSAVVQTVYAPLVITTSTLPNAIQNVAYNQTLAATGGTGAFTWAVTTGSLPTGFSLNASTGVISGTASATGSSSFTIGVSDGGGNSTTANYAISVTPSLAIVSTTLSNGTLKLPYSDEVIGYGGTGSGFTYAVSAGSLPPGLTLNVGTGIISGSPSAAGTYNFTVRITDSSSATATRAFSVPVDGYGVINVQFQSPATNGFVGPAVIGNYVDLWNSFKSPAGNRPILYDDAGNLTGVGITYSSPSGTTVTNVSGGSGGFCTEATPYCGMMQSYLTVPSGTSGTIALTGFVPQSTWDLYLYTQSDTDGRTLSVTANGGSPVTTTTPSATADSAFILNKNYLLAPATADSSGNITLVFNTANGQEADLNGLQLTPHVTPLSITTSSLPSGEVGVAYNQTVAASGGTGLLFSWTVTSGSIPNGLSLNASTGLISGTPTAPGPYNFTITVDDALGYLTSQAYSVVVNPSVSITTSSLPTGFQGVSYSLTLAAGGGPGGNVVWSLASGTLPAGLNLSTTGLISGTPSGIGSASFTVQVTDANSATASQALTLQINAALSVTSSALGQGEVGLPYSQNLSATGGAPLYTWSINSGALQAGLSLNSATGVVSGTPSASGTANLVFKATDTSNNIALSPSLALIVSPALTVTSTTISSGVVGVSYSFPLAASGGLGPYNWTISAGSVPGLGLLTNGTLTGTPQTAGTFTFTARVTDALSVAATSTVGITINPVLTISTAIVPGGSVGVPYSMQLVAAGGTGLSDAFSITAGALPTGVTLNPSTGLLSGTPTSAATFSFTAQVTDSSSVTFAKSYTTTINAFGLLNVQFQSSPATSYAGPAVIGSQSDNWNLFSNSSGSAVLNESHGQPTGVTLSYTGDGAFNSGLRNGFCTAATAYCALMNGCLYKAGGGQGNIVFTGLTPASSWDVYVYTQADSVPGRGISVSFNGGAPITTIPESSADSTFIAGKNYLTGIATADGAGHLLVQFAGISGDLEADIDGMQLRPHQSSLTITQTSAPIGVQGAAYPGVSLSTTGGTGTGQTWSISSGALPTGVQMSSFNGTIGGTPTAAGTYNFIVQVVDSQNNIGTQAFTVVVNPPLLITSASLPPGTLNVAYNQTLGVSGGYGGYTWSVQTGTLPAGLSLTPSTGAIAGTPTAAGSSTVTFQVLDSGSLFQTKTFVIAVGNTLTITTSTLPPAVVGVAYNQTIAAAGGNGSYTFTVTSGQLPAGVQLSSGGLLSGTPTTPGPTSFTVQVSDASSNHATAALGITVNGGIVISTSTLPGATQGTAYSQTLAAAGGVGNLTWSFGPNTTASAAGFTINPATGVLSGTPNTFGTLSVNVSVQDQASNSLSQVIPLTIARQGGSAYDLVVADGSAGKIFRMSSDGTALLTVCGPPAQCHASNVSADAQGNMYTHDTSGVYKIAPGGAVSTILVRNSGVGGTAVDASGNVIFVDNTTDSVYRVTPAGVLTTVAPLPIQSPGELQDTAVTLDSNGNYIVGSDDGGAVKLYQITPAGAATTLATIPGAGITGIVVTNAGIIEFTDYRHKSLVAFDPAGSPNNATPLAIPLADTVLDGLAIDPGNGHFLVPGQNTGVVNRVTPGGAVTVIRSGSPLAGPNSIAAVPALTPLTITTTSLPGGLAGQNYGIQLMNASGGSGSYSWSATGLATGLTLSTGGVLSGGPTSVGSFPGVFTVTDTLTGLTAVKTITIAVTSPVAPLVISGSSPGADVAVGGAISANFSASGGVPPYTFSASGLPQGFSLSPSGSLTGSPASAGNTSVSISVSDTSGRSASTGFGISVLGIQIPSLPNGTLGTGYSATILAIGGQGSYSFSATGLPPGLSISSAGTIAGTPTAGGTYAVSVSVSDGGGARISAGGTITIIVPGAPVTIPSGNLPDATVNVPYSASLSAVGGKSPYSWSVLSGSLPDGLSFSGGSVTGTPTTPGGGGFAVIVTDAAGGTASTGVSINVRPAPIVITSKSPLASGMLGVEYPGTQLSASGGIPPYKWTLSGGSLPAGVTLDSSGSISGTPTVAGDFSPGVTVTDASGTAASTGFGLTIRQVSADLILSAGTASFSLTTGAESVPSGQTIGVQSTVITQQISFSATASPSVPWLTVTSGSKTPDSISIAVSGGALSLSAGDYSTTVKVTCSTGSCAGSSQSVAVSLSVTSPPPRLKTLTDVLSYATTSQNLAPITQTITLQNAGGGKLGVATVACGAPWCSVGTPPSTIPGGGSVTVPVTVNPGSVSSGYFRTTVEIATSAGKSSVPVTLFVAQNSSMTLSPSGGQFSMPQGGAPGNTSGSFLVSVNSSTPATLSASAVPGADWLKVSTTNVSASSSQPGTVSYSIDSTVASTLATGAYYGQISVSGTGISNAPQTYQVVLNVTPTTDVARPDPQPAGLLFLTTIGGDNPPTQLVTVFTSSTKAVQYQASATSDAGWLSVSPGLGSTSQASPATTSVSVNISGLKQGVYSGLVSYAFAGTAVRSVNVTLVVAPVGGTAATLTSSSAAPSVTAPYQPRETCTATSLAAVQTGIVTNFSAPAAWPTPLSLKLVDDCGATVTGAQIVSTFSNGDPPLPLAMVDPKNGLYAGTWTPRKQSSTLTISARITAKGYKDLNMQLVGAVTPNSAPLLTPHGTVHAFSPLVGAPLAPGNIVAIYGSNLAILTGVPNAIPLPTTVNGTQVLIGGIKAPLYFTSPGQVNAQIPYELEPNKQYQVLVSANGALSTPDGIQLVAVVPGLAAYADGTVIAQHADGTLINAKSPAKAGETAIAYLSGLGATDNDVASGGAAPGDILAHPSTTPTLTIGGKDAKIAFVGLTPGLVGLYQMNFEVPAGLSAGNPEITVTQDGTSSAPVLIPYIPK